MATSIWPAASADIGFQGDLVERQIPAIDAHRFDAGAAGLQPGHKAGVGHAILDQADDLLRNVQRLVDQRQHFAPGVGWTDLVFGF